MKTEPHSGTESFMGWFLIPWNLVLAVVALILNLCGRCPWYFAALFAAIAIGGTIQLLCESGRLNPRVFLLPFAALLELALMLAAIALTFVDCRRAVAVADWVMVHLPDLGWYIKTRRSQ